MDIIQLNRDTFDTVRVAFKNVDGGGSVTTGFAVSIVTTAASFDGVNAVRRTAALTGTFHGISINDVAINGFGKATIYGYAASIAISNVGTSITVTAGDRLIPGAVAGSHFSSVTDAAMTTLLYRYSTSGQTTTISALSWVQGYVKGF
jgi:hypothetical protein